MRRGEGDEAEERPACVVAKMFLQLLDGVIRDGRARVVTRFRIDRRQRLVILCVSLRGKMAVVVLDAVRTREAVFQRQPIA